MSSHIALRRDDEGSLGGITWAHGRRGRCLNTKARETRSVIHSNKSEAFLVTGSRREPSSYDTRRNLYGGHEDAGEISSSFRETRCHV